mgnify:CR=1 FL=1
MTIALWIIQVVLALAYLMAGSLKAFRPLDELAKRMPWVSAVPGGLVRFIGVAELLGAVGLILPALTGVLPWLTPLAAVGLVVVQVLAGGFHLSRGEYRNVPVNAALLVLAIVVAYGRFAVAPSA